MKRGRVVIVGGGPAGLSAAASLCRSGFAVSVIEKDLALGGGLRDPSGHSLAHAGSAPPLVFGCDHETKRLLAWIETDQSLHFPPALRFQFALPNGRVAALPRLWGPAILRGPATVAGFTGLPVKDRLNLLNFLERLWEEDIRLPIDLDARPATELWRLAKQSASTIHHIWSPLCRFLIGDEPRALSAASVAASLRTLFLGSRGDSAIGYYQNDVAKDLLVPLKARLSREKVALQPHQVAAQFVTKDARVTGVRLESGTVVTGDWYVSALPPEALASLLPEQWLAQYASFQKLTEWTWLPRVAVQFDYRVKKPRPWLILGGGGSFDWSTGIPRQDSGTADVQIWCLSTGNPTLMKWSDDKLYQQAIQDLRHILPSFDEKAVQGRRIARAAQAIPALRTGTQRLRAVPQSPVANLFLAGAWTDTGWPPNPESAILSGRLCAEALQAATQR
jgi:glycine/D-amino acid oxidase-like deaminating enzyme